MTYQPKQLAQITLVGLLIIGCISVLKPFVGAVLFAFILWLTTWTTYRRWLLNRLKGRKTLGALLATSLLLLFLLIPTLFLALALVDGADSLFLHLRPYLEAGLPPDMPNLLRGIPWLGEELNSWWHKLAGNREELNLLLKQMLLPARAIALGAGKVFANGLLQLCFVFFILFFLYRDGDRLSRLIDISVEKLGGKLGTNMLNKVRDTVFAVMLGIVGTAAGQASVALVGFLIAGVPAPLLLAFATFFLAMIPMGPPLVWIPAVFWLYSEGHSGMAIFLAIYGTLIISSIDNFVKPILMARGSGLSLLTVALGVFGGVIVFGFIGIFLGPVLLALGQMLFMHWVLRSDDEVIHAGN